jgi:hypothetical protein
MVQKNLKSNKKINDMLGDNQSSILTELDDKFIPTMARQKRPYVRKPKKDQKSINLSGNDKKNEQVGIRSKEESDTLSNISTAVFWKMSVLLLLLVMV